MSKLDSVLDNYRMITDAFNDYRDSMFAHLGKLKNANSKLQLTYENVIKIFNSLKIIYDGFLYSVAPDLFSQIEINFNVWYHRLNKISQFYDDNAKKPS